MEVKTRPCVVCGKPIERRRLPSGGTHYRKVCSDECLMIRVGKGISKYPQPKCPICGKLIEKSGWTYNKYCSKECRGNKSKKKVTCHCVICNKPMYGNRAKTCSKECYVMMFKQKKRKTNKVQPNCMICGKLVEKSYNPIGGIYYKKTCSDQCRDKALAQSRKGRPSVSKLKEDEVRNRFNSRYKAFQYVSGYTGCESKITIKCLTCYTEIEYGAQCIRKQCNIQCSACERLRMKKAKEERIKQRLIDKQLKTDMANKTKEQKELMRKRYDKSCMQCNSQFTTKNRQRRFCSNKCLKKYFNNQKEIKRRKRTITNGNYDETITLTKLFQRDKKICHICKNKCDYQDYTKTNGVFIAGASYPSIDHVIAISNGGTHSWDNVKLAHCLCNSIKSNKVETLEQIMIWDIVPISVVTR